MGRRTGRPLGSPENRGRPYFGPVGVFGARMSHGSGTTLRNDFRPPRREDANGRDPNRVDPQRVLDALKDPDCRRILGVVSGVRLVAKECSQVCDQPLSTVYRKLELLETAGLVERNLRILDNGKRASEYGLGTRSVDIELDWDGSLTVVMNHEETAVGP